MFNNQLSDQDITLYYPNKKTNHLQLSQRNDHAQNQLIIRNATTATAKNGKT